MTSPITKTGWNATAGSNLTYYYQGTDAPVNRTALRIEYYRNNYDVRTGLRIAGTLGGFFIFVLVMLLYKSKCKKVISREPSLVPLDNATGLLPGGHPAHHVPGHTPRSSLMTTSGIMQELQQQRSSLVGGVLLPDSSSSAYMNCTKYFNSPAVLLTAANSESSESEDFSTSGAGFIGGDEGDGGGGREEICSRNFNHRHHQYHHQQPRKNRVNNNCCSTPTNKWLQQNIDIHVILPTPTISPSNSETFTRLLNRGGKAEEEEELVDNCCLLDNRECLSGNGSDEMYEMSSLVPPVNCGGALCFMDNLKYVDDTSSENIPTRGSDGCEDPDNDSRRSIGSDSVFACCEYEYGPEHSIAPPPPPLPQRNLSSSSNNNYCPQQLSLSSPPPTTFSNNRRNPRHHRRRRRRFNPTILLREDSAGGRSNSSYYGNEEEDDDDEDEDGCECRVTLIQAQVHHRDSYCSSELESVNDYLESRRRRSSSTQTTLSDLRQCLNASYGGSIAGSSVPSTRSHSSRHSPNPFPFGTSPPCSQQQPEPNVIVSTSAAAPSSTIANYVTTTMTNSNSNNSSGGSSGAIPSTSTSSPVPIPPPPPTNNNNNPLLLRVEPLVNYNQARKRSFDSLKPTYTLQCDPARK